MDDLNQSAPYEQPFSLWELITRGVAPSELTEIKGMLGESLVEQGLDLHNEIELLIDIWYDYHNEDNEVRNVPKLPEPPQVRDRLCQEIEFFVKNIREKCNGQDNLRSSSNHDVNVIDYVMKEKTFVNDSRPSTALSNRSGRETPMVDTPRSNRSQSRNSCASEQIIEMSDKIHYLKFEQVVEHLRDLLAEEIENLKEDTEFLQKCLDGEADFKKRQTFTREPTLAELRSERAQLEKDLLNPDNINNIVSRVQSQSRKGSAHEGKLESLVKNSSAGKNRRSYLAANQNPSNISRDLPPVKSGMFMSETLSNANEKPFRERSARTERRVDHTVERRTGTDLNHTVAAAPDTDLSQTVAAQVTWNEKEEIMLKPASLLKSARLVKVASIPANTKDHQTVLVPKPPTASISTRRSSANRFRQMVMQHRDDS